MSDTLPTSKQLLSFLDEAVTQGASDLHVVGGGIPSIRKDGSLKPLNFPVLTPEQSSAIITEFIGVELIQRITKDRQELDFAFSYKGLRIRANIYFQKGFLAASLRLLPTTIPSLETLGLPSVVSSLLTHNQGLIIVCGPTGHGKSTTLAAMVEHLSSTRRGHVVTIEDPIEYIFEHRKSLVSQREVSVDTPSFSAALRAVLREDPDVVLIGEMRDLATVGAAMEVAETGHLVLTTLHTNSAAQAANRIIGVYPPHQQEQIQAQLANSLVGIISQRLLPKVGGGRVMATEVMVATPAIRSLIRDGKTHQIPNIIQTSAAEGMVHLDKALAELVSKGEVVVEDALAWAQDPVALKSYIY